jgi:hypothetical protein
MKRLLAACLLCLLQLPQRAAVYNSVVSSPCHSDLSMDEAMVAFLSPLNASLLVRNQQCYQCSFVQAAEPDRCARLWSVHRWQFRARLCNEQGQCSVVAHADQVLGEKGRYDLVLSQTAAGGYELSVHETQKPQDSLIPLYVAIAVLAVVTAFFWCLPWIWEDVLGLRLPTPQCQSAASGRLRALDTVRGISLCLMVFVNYGASKRLSFRSP